MDVTLFLFFLCLILLLYLHADVDSQPTDPQVLCTLPTVTVNIRESHIVQLPTAIGYTTKVVDVLPPPLPTAAIEVSDEISTFFLDNDANPAFHEQEDRISSNEKNLAFFTSLLDLGASLSIQAEDGFFLFELDYYILFKGKKTTTEPD
jgi:hypothetical protein